MSPLQQTLADLKAENARLRAATAAAPATATAVQSPATPSGPAATPPLGDRVGMAPQTTSGPARPIVDPAADGAAVAETYAAHRRWEMKQAGKL